MKKSIYIATLVPCASAIDMSLVRFVREVVFDPKFLCTQTLLTSAFRTCHFYPSIFVGCSLPFCSGDKQQVLLPDSAGRRFQLL